MFLSRHSVASAMLPLDLYMLGLFWACHTLFSYSIYIAQCFYWVNPYTILGFFGPFHSFGHHRPALFFWASLAHSILTFPWAFATSFGISWPNCHILYFWGLLDFVPTPFTNSFLWAPLGPFAFFGAFLLFHRPVDHYSYHSGLMVFFLTLLILPPYSLLYCWVSSYYWAFLPK